VYVILTSLFNETTMKICMILNLLIKQKMNLNFLCVSVLVTWLLCMEFWG